jgi:peroxiredoxin
VRSRKADFDQRGIAVIVVSFAEPRKLESYQRHHDWPFVMLADPGRRAYKAFALPRLSPLRVFSLSTLRLYWKLLREGWQRQNYGKDDYYQAGGDFLIDAEGNILFAHCEQNPADRPPAAKLLEVIDDMIRRRQ